MSILIYDDNEENLKIMETSLQHVGYDVKTSSDVIESIKIIEKNCNEIDLVITKYNLSIFSLSDYLYILRKLNKDIRVVVLSSTNNSSEELETIELCVDDYIKKPVSTKVLQKRVEKVLNVTDKNDLYFLKRDLVYIDIYNHNVTRNGEIIHLSMIEYKILLYLVRNSNNVISREELYEKVWNKSFDDKKSRVVDVHISNLRTKLDLECLYSVRGIGYKIEN